MSEKTGMKKIKSTVKMNWQLLVMIVVVTMGSMFVYLNFLATPVYEKKTQLVVNQSDTSSNNGIEVQALQADLQLVYTYSTIITSPRILMQVNQKMNNIFTLDELSHMIRVSNASNSQIIEIGVTNENPEMAAQIANHTATIFQKEITDIMKVDNVMILSEAVRSKTEEPVSPNSQMMYALTFFIALLLGMSIVFIKLLRNQTFSTSEEVSEYLEINVLGAIRKDKHLHNKVPRFRIGRERI